jgi:N-glycosylase/DNA lyase
MTKLTTFFNDLPWQRLGCPRSQLRLDIVLKCGQSFRWTRHDADETLQSWIGVLSGRLWLLAQEQDQLLFKTCSIIKSEESSKAEEAILKDYFQLDVDLVPLYITWSAQDPVFEQLSHTYTGIRMLRQDPVENLFSFICSSNNNIQR